MGTCADGVWPAATISLRTSSNALRQDTSAVSRMASARVDVNVQAAREFDLSSAVSSCCDRAVSTYRAAAGLVGVGASVLAGAVAVAAGCIQPRKFGPRTAEMC